MISEDHVTEDWSNDAENSALITEINYILKYIHIENCYFKLLIIFYNITVLTVFFSNKCSLGETSFNIYIYINIYYYLFFLNQNI